MQSCCVPGCNSSSRVPSHFIPKKPICEEWVKAIKNPKLYGLPMDKLKAYRVCHKHFPESCVLPDYASRRLREGTIPTLNLPNDECNSHSTDASQTNTNNTNMNVAKDNKKNIQETIQSKLKTKNHEEIEVNKRSKIILKLK